MSEKALEKNLYLAVKRLGGRCIKLNPLWNIGIPDRMILMPNGKIYFMELKDKSRISPAQKIWIFWLKTAGFDARVLKGKEIQEFIEELEND